MGRLLDSTLVWLKYIAIQLAMLVATFVGWFLLIPFCLAQAWTGTGSFWSWAALNSVYGNREDGVSGELARIWNAEGTAKVPYMPGAWAPWRAYCWSAWRNSADNLKYVFADPNGPLVTFKLLGRTAKIGWQGGLPVLSL